MTRPSHERLIVAMDGDWDGETLVALAASFAPAVGLIKIGKKHFTRHGPDLVRRLHGLNVPVFLDLKFHDIPSTVAGAVAEATKLGVSMLTLHAAGGAEMLKRAKEAARKTADAAGIAAPRLVGVTVLTSLDDISLAEVGVHDGVARQVERLARLTQSTGLDGVVASPKEISLIRAACGPGFLIVTPGIRPTGGNVGDDDQARVATPAGAVISGADYLVIGRPIYEAADPLAAARAIAGEIGRTP